MESTKKLEVKTELLEENSKLIEAMERDIQYLIDEQENIKVCNLLYPINLDSCFKLLKLYCLFYSRLTSTLSDGLQLGFVSNRSCYG